MISRHFLTWLALAAVAVPSLVGAQQKAHPAKLYSWVDDKGLTHFGDSVPPEYSKSERNVLNNQGIKVGFEEGELTPEKRAEQERVKAEQEKERIAKEEAYKRDKMLVETFLSVADIEDLRDRRLELLESQIKVTELYLTNLRKRLVTLQDEASSYKPYTTREGAPQVPENLQLDLTRTSHSINLYEQTLSNTRAEEKNLRDEFDTNIRRFKELKGKG